MNITEKHMFNDLQELYSWYSSVYITYKDQLRKTKKKGNIYVLLKLIIFSLFAIATYLHYQHTINMAYVFISLGGYIALLVIDYRRKSREKKVEALLKLYSNEIKYLNGDFSSFDNGERYINGAHHYSFDLDLFGDNSLFQEMNRTISQSGADLLAQHLQYPNLESNRIKNKQEAIKELSENIMWVNNFRTLGLIYPIKEFSKSIIEEWSLSKYDIWNKAKVLLYLFNGITATLLILAATSLFSWGYFIVAVLISLFLWIIATSYVNRTHLKINVFIKSISNYLYLIEYLSSAKFESVELKRILADIFNEYNALKAFKTLKRIQSDLDSRGNVLMTVLLNSLYLRDVHTMINISNWHSKYINKVSIWINAIDEMEVLMSMAIYKCNHPDYCQPKISDTTIISAKAIAHPLIKGGNVVTNDVEISKTHHIFIVTGANMSGKSTFLRSVALNHVLAVTGNVVRSEEYYFKPISLFTSMRTTDNLSNGKSYFQAELLRLKELHKKAENGADVLIILDEMLKGTNSEDKLNGSWKFLEKLLTFNVSGLVATHDLKLGELQLQYPNNFQNICFEIEHCNNDLVYTYKLQNGISKNMNATFLLNKMQLI